MESSGLEFYTTRELIAELMCRQTFLGVVVHSEEEYRDNHWGAERVFKVHFNSNLQAPQAGRLLDAVGSHISKNYRDPAS
jgi:hypothetical protein